MATTEHTCRKSSTCTCNSGRIAIEPSEKCPVHGCPFPPRCGECGRFLPLWKPGQSPSARRAARTAGNAQPEEDRDGDVALSKRIAAREGAREE